MFIALPEAFRSQCAWSCRKESKSWRTASVQAGDVWTLKRIQAPGLAHACHPEERSDEGSAPPKLEGREQILRGACPERSRRAQDDRGRGFSIFSFPSPFPVNLFGLPAQVFDAAVVDDRVGCAQGGGLGADLRGDAAASV